MRSDLDDQDVALVIIADGFELLFVTDSGFAQKDVDCPCSRHGEVVHRLEVRNGLIGAPDHLDDEGQPLQVMTFGTVREICPKCQSGHLKLVLRQSAVRMAHLFCADCASCFDAHYPDGAPALTI